MRGFRLAAVLRARKAQEDVAKAAAAAARGTADVAATRVRVRERELDDSRVPDESSATAFAAALWARQALAGALSGAIAASQAADETVRNRLDDLTAAAVRRRALEHLAERHAQARRRADEAAEQRGVDELAAARFLRHRGEGRVS